MPEHRTGTGGMTFAAPERVRLGEAGPVALLFAVNAAAWALSAERMAGMDAGPGADLGELGWFAVSWLVMMAAMTLPRGHADGRGVR